MSGSEMALQEYANFIWPLTLLFFAVVGGVMMVLVWQYTQFKPWLKQVFCWHAFEAIDSTSRVLYQKCPKCEARRTVGAHD